MSRNLDTSGIGRKALLVAETIIHNANHILQRIDGDLDDSIDGFIRIRKKIEWKKIIKNKENKVFDYVDTGDIIGIQVKGVSKIPINGSESYYITLQDKTKFGVNFGNADTLGRHKSIWKNFIGPVIIVFVDLETKQCWWADTENAESYGVGGYSMIINKANLFNESSFKIIKKLGKELFAGNKLVEICTQNHDFPHLSLSNFKDSAREVYDALNGKVIPFLFFPDTVHPKLGQIKFTLSGWKHITRLNRRKMRIFNSLILLPIAHEICTGVSNYTRVKKGVVRESKRFIKKADFLTLRALIHFNFRQSSVVQVVLRRVKTFDKVHASNSIPDQVFFHSIYEPYRKE